MGSPHINGKAQKMDLNLGDDMLGTHLEICCFRREGGAAVDTTAVPGLLVIVSPQITYQDPSSLCHFFKIQSLWLEHPVD